MSYAGKIVKALKEYGRPMLLRRRVGTSTAYQDVTVTGISQGYKAQELLGGLQQGDRRVIISNEELAAQSTFAPPPKKGDFVQVDGALTAIQTVDTQRLGSEILAHILTVRG